MARKPVAFQFYPNDWLGSTRRLTMEQKGAYIDLLCEMWNAGPMSEQETQAFFLGFSWEVIWDLLQKKFKLSDDGKWYNERLEEERRKQAEFREKQSKNGSRGGRPRVSQNPTDNPNESQTETQGEAKQKPSVTDTNIKPPTPFFIPEPLRCVEFETAWNRWTSYLEAIHGRLNAPQLNLHLKKCLETLHQHGMAKVCADLDVSIEGGSKGAIYNSQRQSRPGAARANLPKLVSSFSSGKNPYADR